ncbi:hypothetical protein EFK07_08950 [Pseudomonas putida]|uniref:Uncharacterized protein n=1 Tax=Pseudomonas putida TaxID=303 RepID=A0A3M8THQ5_PSEPU|nr:hypothetical protein EFK07_08950 [Pseudomonas putida]
MHILVHQQTCSSQHPRGEPGDERSLWPPHIAVTGSSPPRNLAKTAWDKPRRLWRHGFSRVDLLALEYSTFIVNGRPDLAMLV